MKYVGPAGVCVCMGECHSMSTIRSLLQSRGDRERRQVLMEAWELS